MEQWDVVAVIIALVGLIISVVAPVIKLTRAITRLTTTMENMEKNVVDLTTNNRLGHERLWEHSRQQDQRICDHETRIRVMEEER
ncbi:MAG: DUF948 domain-containing protein [Clostridia bacterium]